MRNNFCFHAYAQKSLLKQVLLFIGNKENNVFKDALGVKGLGFKHHGNHPGNCYTYHIVCSACHIGTPCVLTYWSVEAHLYQISVYIICVDITIGLQYNKHNQPIKLGFSLVAALRFNLLRRSRSPKIFQEKLNYKVRQSTTGAIQ